MIEFHLPITPKAQKRARHGRLANGHSVTYKDAGQRQNEDDLISLMAPYAPEKPMSGAISVRATAVFPVPNSWSKKKKDEALAGHVFMTTKPDIDNLEKQLFDCMTRLRFWDDDKQVVLSVMAKCYAEENLDVGWHVDIEGLDNLI